MDKDKRVQRPVNRKKKLLRLIVFLVCLAVIGAGIKFYLGYMEEKQRRIELEEQKRKEEEEKELQRKLLEEKRKEFDALVQEMQKCYASGNFKEAREIAKKALALAEKYGFNTEEIYRILHLMDIKGYAGRLKELQKMNEDIYKYQYVRNEVLKIPGWVELKRLKEKILRKTYENEYMVLLTLAKKDVISGQKGEMVSYHYFISREYFNKAVSLRHRYNIIRSPEEDTLREIQKKFFFASKKLTSETIPPGLY
jgi:hypothetical protein